MSLKFIPMNIHEDKVKKLEELANKIRQDIVSMLAPDLAKLENIVLTPHIASATEETREKLAIMAAKNIIAGLSGKRPPQLVKIR